MTERWLPIIGYEGLYFISNLGRVRSTHRGGAIRATPLVAGYPSLFLSKDGVKTFFYVHILVATMFIGPRPVGKEVAHGNGASRDASLSNLRYATPVENDADKIAHGTRPNGERNGQSKLTKNQVLDIRLRYANFARTSDLAAEFGVGVRAIQKIVSGVRWGSL
jgi:HNH endonuclease/NUMOD4 motif